MFTNTDLSLKYVDVYGFDFDYTLVHYTKEVHRRIYEMARDRLVAKLNVCTVCPPLRSTVSSCMYVRTFPMLVGQFKCVT